MQPGERVSYSSFDQDVINERVAVQPVIAWKDGFWYFGINRWGKQRADLKKFSV